MTSLPSSWVWSQMYKINRMFYYWSLLSIKVWLQMSRGSDQEGPQMVEADPVTPIGRSWKNSLKVSVIKLPGLRVLFPWTIPGLESPSVEEPTLGLGRFSCLSLFFCDTNVCFWILGRSKRPWRGGGAAERPWFWVKSLLLFVIKIFFETLETFA